MIFDQIRKVFIDLLFPRKCLGCGREQYIVCEKCLSKISFTASPFLLPDKSIMDVLISCVDYKKNTIIKKMITNFKYKFDKEISLVLSQLLKTRFVHLSQLSDFFECVIFVPVPLHRKRLNYRGFNQSLILAEYLLMELKNDPELGGNFKNIKLVDCLRRTLYRVPQAESTLEARIKNVEGVMEIDKSFCELIKNRFVFVIDDVATTCSTLNECAKVLKKAGAGFVCGFVLAKA